MRKETRIVVIPAFAEMAAEAGRIRLAQGHSARGVARAGRPFSPAGQSFFVQT